MTVDVKSAITKTIIQAAEFTATVEDTFQGEPLTITITVGVTQQNDASPFFEVKLGDDLLQGEILTLDEMQALSAVLGQALQWKPEQNF